MSISAAGSYHSRVGSYGPGFTILDTDCIKSHLKSYLDSRSWSIDPMQEVHLLAASSA